MKEHLYIPVDEFCISHKIEVQWIKSLEEYGLITVIVKKEVLYLSEKELKRLERILVFNRELEINLAGIETIFHLLERLERTQEEKRVLENKLQKYKYLEQ